MTDGLYDRFAGLLEDFWGRRRHAALYLRRFHVFGQPVELSSNSEPALTAADYSAPLYSAAPPLDAAPFRIQLAVRKPDAGPDLGTPVPGTPVPEDLPSLIRYAGSADWGHLDIAGWGQCFADFNHGDAVVVLSEPLAERPDLVSRGILNTLLNNFLTRHGHAMLHATGLVQGDRVLMLMAPHNSGKSTTALRLTLSGQYRLLSDSQVYVTQADGAVRLAGFPVGRGKLRRDMLPEFPALEGLLTPELVREETKFVLDLRRLDPGLICEEAVVLRQVDWCFLSRSDAVRSTLRQASESEAWEMIMLNSLHYDEKEVWEENLKQIDPLVRMARFWKLELGRNGEDVVEVVRSIE